MRGSSSGWLSDCSLAVDEYKYIEGKVKNGRADEANKLKFFRRYRDDCTSINVDDFLTISGEIYPPSLDLTQENDNHHRADVLDMSVSLENGNIITKVFCKTDLFPFDVISLPFLESNLDNKICYKVFYGQIVRFQRLCSFKHHFEERACFLLKILLERHYNLKFLKREFCKAVEKYISEFQRWAIPVSIHELFEGLASRTNSNND